MTTQTIRWDGEFIVWVSPPLPYDALEYLTGQGAPRYPLPVVKAPYDRRVYCMFMASLKAVDMHNANRYWAMMDNRG